MARLPGSALWSLLQQSMWGGYRPGDETIEAETTYGRVKGFRKKKSGIICFRGIPYAKAPRFQRPSPPDSWEGTTRDCTSFGKICVQGANVIFLAFMPKLLAGLVWGFMWLTGNDPLTNTDVNKPQPLMKECSEEESLSLNIETPSVSDGSRLPVMVWIHGGGFQLGAGSQFVYHPDSSDLSRLGNVVLVTINYRLGLLGFLKVDGGDYNCAIRDQIAALEWVQQNIHHFGGDNTNVTIFGESAGGMSCATLTACGPQASPGGPIQGRLFHKAILQSGGMQVGITRRDAEQVTSHVARLLSLEHRDLSVSCAELMDMAAAKLLTAQNAVIRSRKCGPMPFQPMIDGELLPDSIVNCWKAGSAKDLAFLISYTRDEELLFLKLFPRNYLCNSEQDLCRRVGKTLSPGVLDVPELEATTANVVQELKDWEGGAANHGGASGSGYWTNKAVMFDTQLRFAIPAHLSAEVLVQSSRRVYMARFDIESPLLNGASHAIDLPFVFGACELWGRMVGPDQEANSRVSEAVVRAWCNFAKSGDPNAHSDSPATISSLPRWPVCTPEEPSIVMVLDVPLSRCRTQHVLLHQSFPTVWKVAMGHEKALWFHRDITDRVEGEEMKAAEGSHVPRSNL